MQFWKVYTIEGPQARKTESTDEGVIREMTKKKNDDDDDRAVAGGGGAMGSQAVSKSAKSCPLLEFYHLWQSLLCYQPVEKGLRPGGLANGRCLQEERPMPPHEERRPQAKHL